MDGIKGDQEFLNSHSLVGGMPPIITAAHELKSPIVLIRQLALALQDTNFTVEEKSRIINQILLTSERALRLTTDLTRSVNLSDAMFKLEPINPQQICEDVVHELKPLFEANKKEIKFINRKHPLLLVANRDLLRRIITNFSDNALHYSGESKTVEIRIGSLKSGSIIRLAVRDYGPDLNVKDVKMLKNGKLLETHFINNRPQSSGLGIYIASQFAIAMHGKIGITRHRKVGTTFYVDLQASKQLSLL